MPSVQVRTATTETLAEVWRTDAPVGAGWAERRQTNWLGQDGAWLQCARAGARCTLCSLGPGTALADAGGQRGQLGKRKEALCAACPSSSQFVFGAANGRGHAHVLGSRDLDDLIALNGPEVAAGGKPSAMAATSCIGQFEGQMRVRGVRGVVGGERD